jgi:hypothetical protein
MEKFKLFYFWFLRLKIFIIKLFYKTSYYINLGNILFLELYINFFKHKKLK